MNTTAVLTSQSSPGHVPRRSAASASLLTPEDIREFRELLRVHCEIEVDEDEAAIRAHELVMLYRMLLGPIPEDPQASEESSNI